MITASDSQSAITLSNFRVTYHAPRYEDGQVLYDGYCAILADDAALDGAEVRVFDVPDVDEGQLAAAMFACDAMNQHEQMRTALVSVSEVLNSLALGQVPEDERYSELCRATKIVADATTTSK